MNATALFITLALALIAFVIILIAVSAAKKNQNPAVLKADADQNKEVFAAFSYTDAEWEYVNQKEFLEDERGKGFFSKYSGIIIFDQIVWENSERKIYFTPQEIYLTDGQKGKSFTVNKLNFAANGFRLLSMDLLHLAPLKKLRVKISGIGISPESSDLDFELEYLVPIPQSSLAKIDEILKIYGDIILNG